MRTLSVLACLLAVTPLATGAVPTQPVLPLALAQKMIAACVSLATSNHWRMGIVVKDAGDNLLAFARMDGAVLAVSDGAMQKATAAARLGAPTSAIAKFAFEAKTGMPTAAAFTPGMALFPGGLPIKTADGHALGAIGVSGSAPADDERCAQAGLDAVASDLR
jgi:uncharacterized protein GlcG (DUF336 family)